MVGGPSFSISAWLAGTVKKKKLVLLGTLLHTVPVVSETAFPEILQQFWFGIAQYLF